MSVELLQTLSVSGYVISGILFVLTMILFFVLKVPKLIGSLSGATARKAIEDIRKQSGSSSAAFTSSQVNADRGRLTDKISPSGRLVHNTGMVSPVVAKTTLLTSEGGNETTILRAENSQLPLVLKIELDIGFWESSEIIA